MHDKIAALALKHALAPAVVRDLESLLAPTDGATAVVEGSLPIGLGAAVPPDVASPPTRPARAPAPIAGRYVDQGPIAMGGMGEVRRVRDLAFNRTLAMKTLHPDLVRRPAMVARFLEEAQATAQLQHPNIVPIHDVGTHADGRAWFTMREVRGRTLAQVVEEVHAASIGRWEPGATTGFTFRRLTASFLQACLAVAYAHERGVVHRDLKPDNVMIGAHGEVVVLDWGLAKLVGRPERAWDGPHIGLGLADAAAEGTVVSLRVGHGTQLGEVAGTPAYMAPEQARGDVDRIDARTDVYALGAMLYEILAGRPPYSGTAVKVLAEVLAGPPPPVAGTGPEAPPLPEELVAACDRAMARDPDQRFPSALALAAEVEAWLDGARRRDQALEVVARAGALASESRALAEEARRLREEADRLLVGVAPWEPEERKAPAWNKAAEAAAAELGAELKQLEIDETLRAALQISADLPEAHAALVARHLERHRAAEAAREPTAKVEVLLRPHVAALPDGHPVRREAASYLAGDGALSLVTDPPGAEVALFRYVIRNRRLVEVFERSLGTTPLRSVPLPMGSYLCVVRHPHRDAVRYPVEITRHGHWDGVRPGEAEARPVWLPPPGFLARTRCTSRVGGSGRAVTRRSADCPRRASGATRSSCTGSR